MIFRESETVELKEVVVDDIKKEVIAFANCRGGKIYVGVDDEGEIIGVDDEDAAIQQISNMIRDNIKPDVTMFVHYKTLDVIGSKIIEIDVQMGTNRPYYIAKKGLRPEGVYVRQGNSAVPATDTAIRQMIKETDGESFEEMRSLNQELTFKATSDEFLSRHILFEQPQKQTLKLLTSDGVYTNLGLLLSEQCVHTIKVAVFQGTDQSAFKDRREFAGSLIQQMNEVYTYIDFHNQTKSTFDKLYRVDTRDYPEIALREALLNLLVHRDYSFRSSSFISIFTDRIEFISVGGLLPGIALNDVLLGMSICRNPNLANVFYRLQLIEAYGTGIQKIMNAYKCCKKTPRIETSDNAFKIILPNSNYLQIEKENSEEHVILDYLKQNEIITRSEVEKMLEVGTTTAYRILKRMTENGILTQYGKGKNTKYKKLPC
ncbi:MAG: putative DNA binding domain-containing protein [Clostridia bacterium]|nr:putative DNA binding domain-containing protein [Clostridia bacterium]